MSPKELQCILLFDEVAIKKNIDFSRKENLVEGFEDLGEFGRRPVLATETLVLMLRGIFSEWKIPISYYFSENGVNSTNLKDILFHNIASVFDCRFKVRAVVCDQSTTNQKLIKDLNITNEKPFFNFNENKIFTIFDVPHLIKNLRNNLMENDYILHENIISWSIINF